MKFRHELRYDAPPAAVFEMLADPAFRERVCEDTGFPKREVTISPRDGGMAVRIDQHRPADELPGFVRKLVGQEINVVQEEEWASPTGARLEVTIPGKPGEMTGTATLVGANGGVTEKVDMTVKVNLPLIGGKVEGLIADMLLKALRAEHHVGQEWLAGQS